MTLLASQQIVDCVFQNMKHTGIYVFQLQTVCRFLKRDFIFKYTVKIQKTVKEIWWRFPEELFGCDIFLSFIIFSKKILYKVKIML